MLDQQRIGPILNRGFTLLGFDGASESKLFHHQVMQRRLVLSVGGAPHSGERS